MGNSQKGKRNVLLVFLLIFMFILAISSTVLGVLIPKMQQNYTLTYVQIGYLSSVQNVGGFVVMLLGSVLSDRFPKLRLIAAFVTLYVASILCMSIMPPYWLMLLLFFMTGAMVNGLSTLVSAYISETCGKKSIVYLNLSHGFYGIGCLVGPLYATVLFSLNLHWTTLYLSLGIVCAVTLLFYAFLLFRTGTDMPTASTAQEKVHDISLLKNRRLWSICIACCIFMGQQTAFSTWITSYSLSSVTNQATLANSVTSLYWLGIAVGRFLQSAWSKKIDPLRSVSAGCVISALLITLGVFSKNIWVWMLLVALSGICTGPVFPNLIGAGGRVASAMTGTATFLICLSGSIGGIIFPWVVAKLVAKFFEMGIMMAPVGLIVTAVLLMGFLKTEKREEE